jgi:hypothetical protein
MKELDLLLSSLAPTEAFTDKSDPTWDAGLNEAKKVRQDIIVKLANVKSGFLFDLIKAGFTPDQIKEFEVALEISKCIGFYDCRILFGEILQSQNLPFNSDKCSKTNQNSNN